MACCPGKIWRHFLPYSHQKLNGTAAQVTKIKPRVNDISSRFPNIFCKIFVKVPINLLHSKQLNDVLIEVNLGEN